MLNILWRGKTCIQHDFVYNYGEIKNYIHHCRHLVLENKPNEENHFWIVIFTLEYSCASYAKRKRRSAGTVTIQISNVLRFSLINNYNGWIG